MSGVGVGGYNSIGDDLQRNDVGEVALVAEKWGQH